ncbi:uncharacterized protein [Chelonus insularis]|uniref:uncharacterized protein n=1 Tax=Chelonus insularis TaxID=460826 RepID=UPI001589E210|nr:uncharacterized protein LOC118063607 [Chelonus insularis]XP_034933574.1 uncharacterized protein LOC118063607 [Chelonus insularis]XP_034933575.1 uncharacterized protein LOC118063607 [Chelonus insularis]XP_034933577.1 uncharacterized protein LOC118063607 [Chelonus insularis]
MLKHIPTGQPSSAGSRNHHHEYPTQISGTLHHHFGSGSTTSARVPRINDSTIYDSVLSSQKIGSVHRHPLNHSQLSVNNLASKLNHTHSLNLSALSASKHSIDSASPVGNEIIHHHNNNHHNNSLHHHLYHHHHQTSASHQTNTQVMNERTIQANGGLDISRLSRLPSRTTPSPAPVATIHAPVSQPTQPTRTSTNTPGLPVPTQDTSWTSFCLRRNPKNPETGVKEMLTFLGLLCLVSLLLAMLSHIFLLKISPVSVSPTSLISPEEYTIVYEITLALCALAMSLNLCCLLVCAIQFLFAMKLVKSSYNQSRTSMYLQKSSVSRMCAIGGFFVSIPVFLTGMILYTFIQFHSTPAIIISVFIGLGIIFCGCAMVHNVFVWQKEKTNAVKELAKAQCEAAIQFQRQQMQQQQQQLQQTNSTNRIPSTLLQNNCSKMGNSTLPHSYNHLRGQYSQNKYQPHHHEQNRMMSPALRTLSASPAVHNHSSDIHRVLTSPPATPAEDHSPTSPINKSLNRSHLQREASGSCSPGLPTATLDLSSAANTNSPHELSTLV